MTRADYENMMIILRAIRADLKAIRDTFNKKTEEESK